MLWVSPGFSTQSDGLRMRNLSRQLKSGSWSSALILPQPCLLLLVLALPFRHRWEAASKAEIMSTAERAIMADVEQMKKTFPFVTYGIALWSKCLVSIYLIWFLGSKLNPFKQPIQSNPVGSGNVSHCGTSTFDNHFDYSLIVLQDTQHSTKSRWSYVWRNVINIIRIQIDVLRWIWVFSCGVWCFATGLPATFDLCFSWFDLVRNEIL